AAWRSNFTVVIPPPAKLRRESTHSKSELVIVPSKKSTTQTGVLTWSPPGSSDGHDRTTACRAVDPEISTAHSPARPPPAGAWSERTERRLSGARSEAPLSAPVFFRRFSVAAREPETAIGARGGSATG